MCSHQKYKNFVPSSENCYDSTLKQFSSPVSKQYISGPDAKRIYLEVVSQKQPTCPTAIASPSRDITLLQRKPISTTTIQSDHQLFLAAQNNQSEVIKIYLTENPDRVNIIDEYGWSLLMIACQAHAVNTVKVLLDLNVDTYIRDKGGNSANTLVLQSKNLELTNLFLHYKESNVESKELEILKEESTYLETYECKSCEKTFKDKKEHISSTVHNMHSSKGKKTKVWYKIPESNRGFQMLVKSGWEKQNGLGPEGLGKRYPIKAIIKKDRKGIGAAKPKSLGYTIEAKSVKSDIIREREKAMERKFRREFE